MRIKHCMARAVRLAAAGIALSVASVASAGTVFHADFENGADGFTVDNAGFGGGNGQWHLSTACEVPSPGHTTGQAFYFGQDATCVFEVGVATAGAITSPNISLAMEWAPIQMKFRYFLWTENGASAPLAGTARQEGGFFDVATAEVSVNGGPFQVVASNIVGGVPLADGSGRWEEAAVDLSAFQGEIIQVRFTFNSGDDIANDFPGFYVDDVWIQSKTECCPPAGKPADPIPPDGAFDVDPDRLKLGFIGSGQSNCCEVLYAAVVQPAPLSGGAEGGDGGTLPSDLYRIDPVTGIPTFVGPIGFNGVNGLAFAPDGALFGTCADPADPGGAFLITIDPVTGAGSPVGPVDFASDPTAIRRAPSIQFNADGELLANAIRQDISDVTLIEIDTNTGLAAPVFGPSGLFGPGNGLGIDKAGTIYSYSADNSCINVLDPITGAAIGCLNPPGTGPRDINNMAYCADLDIMWASLNADGQNAAESLITIDLATGAVTNQYPTIAGVGAIAFPCTCVEFCPGFERPVPECFATNGGFETGDETGWNLTENGVSEFRPWQVSGAGFGGGFGMLATAPPQGAFVAWNGFDGGAGLVYEAWQEVFIPVNASSAVLSWTERIQWNFTLGGTATMPRVYSVQVQPAGGGAPLVELFNFSFVSPDTGNTGFVPHTRDLLSAGLTPGQTYRLVWRQEIPENATGPAQFELDAVSLNCGDGSVPLSLNTFASRGGPPVVSGDDAPSLQAAQIDPEDVAMYEAIAAGEGIVMGAATGDAGAVYYDPNGELTTRSRTFHQQAVRATLGGVDRIFEEGPGGPMVILFKDVAPFGDNRTEVALNNLGIPFVVLTSADMGAFDLSIKNDIFKVVIEADQTDAFYDALEANSLWFELYAKEGGLLDIHAASTSFNPGDISDRVLPGGFVVDPSGTFADNLQLIAPGHPIFTTPNPIAETDLEGVNASTHRTFSQIPDSSDILIIEQDSGARQTAAVDASFGDGRIFATTQTISFGGSPLAYLENTLAYNVGGAPGGNVLAYIGGESYFADDGVDFATPRNQLRAALTAVDKSLLEAEVLPPDLSTFDAVFLIVNRRAWSAAELNTLVDYVLDGGCLVAMGDHSVLFTQVNANMNALAMALGSSMSIVDASLDNGCQVSTTVFDNLLTTGVDQFALGLGSEVSGGTPLLGYNAPGVALAVEGIGAGQFLLSGDGNIFVDDCLPNPGNTRLFQNIACKPRIKPDCCDVLYGAATGGGGSNPSSLYLIDAATGAATLIGPIGFNGVTGLSFSREGVLYGTCIDPDTGGALLITVNPATGMGAPVGPVIRDVDMVQQGRVPDISFAPNGRLFGYGDAAGGDVLLEIDTATGFARVIDPSGTGFFGGGNGLDFAPDGTLYATPFDNNCLVEMNPFTGNGVCVPGSAGNVPDRVNALEHCPETGVLYGSLNDSASVFGAPNSLVTIDPTDGTTSLVGATVDGLDAVTFRCKDKRPLYDFYLSEALFPSSGAPEGVLPPLTKVCENQAMPMCQLACSLQSNAFYFWQVVCKNPGGVAVGPLWQFETGVACPADFNGDGIVDGADLGLLLQAWGTPCLVTPICPPDLNKDGNVDGADLGLLLQQWGNCPGVGP